MLIQKQITNEQQVPFTVNFTTLGGQPAEVDGPVVWETLNGNSTIIDLAADGKSLKFRSEDGIGLSRFKGTGDADLGAGFIPVSIEVELDVIGPQAASAGGTFGDAELKTPTPTP